MRRRLSAAALALVLVVGGCKAGPNFQGPGWAEAPISWITGSPRKQAGVVSEPVAQPIDPEWWAIFHDPQLTRLESQVAGANLDVRAAGERIIQSRAELGVTGATLYPVFNANASGEKLKSSNVGVFSGLGSAAAGSKTTALQASGAQGSLGAGGVRTPTDLAPLNIFQYGFDASWEPDIWGRAQRALESGNAALSAAAWSRRAALLSALAEVARDYINLRGTQEQLRTARENVRTAEQGLKLTRERATAGVTTELDVANAAAQVRITAAQIPALEAEARALINALGLLLGEAPGTLMADLQTPRPAPPVPPTVPVGFPSELARRRPDIQQSEALLHEAVANIGVAQADFYPAITLTGSFGFQSLQFSKLFGWSARQWAIGPGITLPIFEGGRLRYTLDLRKSQQREAAINYQRTVLTAWTEVDNALTAFRDEQRRRSELEGAVAYNRRALALARNRYQEGVADFLSVLDAERSLLSAELQLASSTTAVSADLVALYKALGGGWQVGETSGSS